MPLSLFKHSTQSVYNKRKWGLDKCTEHYLKVKVQTKKISLEGNYTMRMFCGGAVSNSWQYGRSKVVKAYSKAYATENDGARPSNAQIRSKLASLPLDDYVYDTSLEWLQKLERDAERMQHGDNSTVVRSDPFHSAQAKVSVKEQMIIDTIQLWKKESK